MTDDAMDAAKAKADSTGTTDKAQGTTDNMVGTVKAKVGNLFGDSDLEAKGMAQSTEGKAQTAKGEVKETLHEAAEKVKAGVGAVSEMVKDAMHKAKE